MTRSRSAAFALAALLTAPLPADAQPHGGGGPRGGGGRPQPAMPMRRPAPAAPSRPAGGFNLEHDARPPNSIAPVRAPQRPPVTAMPAQRRPPGGYPPRPPQPAGGYAPPRPPHTVIANPAFGGRPWAWNRGTVWVPAEGYYGGGFWGPFAISTAAAFAYGSIVNGGQTYVSYGVAPESPGAELLANYQLTQTDCNQGDLVVIYGPDGSVICAYPSALVGPGNYTVDPSGLSISSE